MLLVVWICDYVLGALLLVAVGRLLFLLDLIVAYFWFGCVVA